MNEFVVRALIGGALLAFITAPVGSLMLWRKRAFFGAAIAEGAILGVVLGFILGWQPIIGAAIICIAMALLIEMLIMEKRFSGDTVIGVIGHAALAAALVCAVYVPRTRIDFYGYLFGDIFSLNWNDVILVGMGAVVVLAPIVGLWKNLVLATAEPEIAAAEGIPINALTFGFAVLLAIVVALGLQAVGALLIVALLVMPAAAARRFSRTPSGMVFLAIVFTMVAIGIGIVLSSTLNWPGGPAITLAALGLFLILFVIKR